MVKIEYRAKRMDGGMKSAEAPISDPNDVQPAKVQSSKYPNETYQAYTALSYE